MEQRLDRKIAKYEEVLKILKENFENKAANDDYPYKTDITNTIEYLKDLRSIKYGKLKD